MRKMKRKLIIYLLLFGCLLACAPSAEVPSSLTPTMGWSSWNTFAHDVTAALVKSQADAMVATGLKEVGYCYINTDDGYFGGRDSLDGHLLVHTEKFPDGLRPVVDYIHSLGLKAGIYTDAGANTCGAIWAGNTSGENCGLYGHDEQDLTLFFRDLGFDLTDYDDRTLSFARDYSEKILAIDVNINTTEMLDITWGLLGKYFKPEEVNIKKELVDTFWPKA